MIYIIIIFSFLFESIMSNIVNMNSLFVPLFTLVSLSLVYPYFKKKYNNFIIVCGIVGLLYDIIFTNSLFINTISFILLSFLIIYNYKLFKYNILFSNLFNIILIACYRFISYILLVIIGYTKFNFYNLINGIYTSLIINIIYGVIIYIIIKKLAKILNIRF